MRASRWRGRLAGSRGFTLVELLVVISIIGMLVAITLPAIIGTREIARRNDCANNLRQLSLGHLGFHNAQNRFCGWANSVGATDFKPVSWHVMIFPYIDRTELYFKWAFEPFQDTPNAPNWAAREASHPHVYLENYVCKSNPPHDERKSPSSYIANAGSALDSARGENPANGVFHNQYPVPPGPYDARQLRSTSLAYLTANDGASKTALLSENVQWVAEQNDPSGNSRGWRPAWTGQVQTRADVGFVWHVGDLPVHRRINGGKKNPSAGDVDYARPSSNHPQGVNMSFGDGHVRFISESIRYEVYRQLMTPAGLKSDDPTRSNPLDDGQF